MDKEEYINLICKFGENMVEYTLEERYRFKRFFYSLPLSRKKKDGLWEWLFGDISWEELIERLGEQYESSNIL